MISPAGSTLNRPEGIPKVEAVTLDALILFVTIPISPDEVIVAATFAQLDDIVTLEKLELIDLLANDAELAHID